MKKLSLITFAVTAFLFVSTAVSAQNNGSRNMQKRGADNTNGQYNQQGSGQYGGNQNDQDNGQYNRGNNDQQYGQGNEQYGRGNNNEQYGRREGNRRSGFRFVLSSRGGRNNRYRDNDRRRSYDRSCNSRSYHRDNY